MLFQAWKKCAIIILMSVFCIGIICVCLSVYDHKRINGVYTLVTSAETSEKISVWQGPDGYELFLPSYTDADSLHLKCDAGYRLLVDGVPEREIDYRALLKRPSFQLQVKSPLGATVLDITVRPVQSASVSTLSVTLADGSLEAVNSGSVADVHSDRRIELSGSMKLIRADGTLVSGGAVKSFHGRGNASWDLDKKPYAMELEAAADLLGSGADTHWVLLSSACDASFLRNKFALETAEAVGLAFSPRCEYIDLYVNREYLGLYLLVEKIEIAPNRIAVRDLEAETALVNPHPLSIYKKYDDQASALWTKGYLIPNDPADITGGYLMELEYEPRLSYEDTCFNTGSGLYFTVKSPKHASQAQMRYAQSYMQSLEDALIADAEEDARRYLDYIDLDSWVKYYLVQESLQNTDYVTSVFFYKDTDANGGKLYAGPVWDFDWSLNQCHFNLLTAPPGSDALSYNAYGWFALLCRIPSFQAAVKAEYAGHFRSAFQSLLASDLPADAAQIDASFRMDSVRWRTMYRYGNIHMHDTVQEHLSEIASFLSERIAFLDRTWLGGAASDAAGGKEPS